MTDKQRQWAGAAVLLAAAVSLVIIYVSARSSIDVGMGLTRSRPVPTTPVAPSFDTVNASSPTRASSTPPPEDPASLADIPSNFDVAAHAESEGSLPASSASEPTGNFRLVCQFSHYAADDPIVSPDRPGASHLHMFFGNTLTSASSTWASLRRTGDGTCNGGPVNRTGYWAPALSDGAGHLVTPEAIIVYYKDGIAAQIGRAVEPFPNGLKMIAGHNRNSGLMDTDHWYWECVSKSEQITGEHLAQLPTCAPGGSIEAFVSFPQCWDGVNLDSPNHRSHMAYPAYVDGVPGCPADHAVMLPAVSVGIQWRVLGGDDTSTWALSSDSPWGTPPGASLHADWFGAWDGPTLDNFVKHCINGKLNCIDGELGDGRRLSSAAPTTEPRLVSAP